MKRRIASLAAPLLLAAVPALAQITTVPMKGVGNEWVKQLELQGRMEWEWIETYPEVVYFVTRHEAERNGDIVTMWMRIEYKHPQHPLEHRSALSHDDWDCKHRTRSTRGVFFYAWNNLQTDRPSPSTRPTCCAPGRRSRKARSANPCSTSPAASRTSRPSSRNCEGVPRKRWRPLHRLSPLREALALVERLERWAATSCA